MAPDDLKTLFATDLLNQLIPNDVQTLQNDLKVQLSAEEQTMFKTALLRSDGAGRSENAIRDRPAESIDPERRANSTERSESSAVRRRADHVQDGAAQIGWRRTI